MTRAVASPAEQRIGVLAWLARQQRRPTWSVREVALGASLPDADVRWTLEALAREGLAAGLPARYGVGYRLTRAGREAGEEARQAAEAGRVWGRYSRAPEE